MLSVNWVRCAGGVWCELEKVNVAGSPTLGTYVVWVGQRDRRRAVRIGWGRIAEVVRTQRHDVRVLRFRSNGTLYVTWAALGDYESQGAALYLNRTMRPVLADRLPEVGEIEVNPPWTTAAR